MTETPTRSATVRLLRDDAILTVMIDRPEARNAVDRPTAEALAEAFRSFESDERLHVAVLGGAGGTFCAGADLKAIGTERGNRVEPDGDGPLGPSRMTFSKPVIAAIEGHAVAGGLELACLADLRVAAEDAVLGVFCRRWGVPLIDGGTVRLPRIVGLGRALDLILTGRPVDAREALAMGLVNRVVAKGTALEAAQQLAREIASFPVACLHNDRRSTYESFDRPFEEAMRREFELGVQSLASPEMDDGLGRFRGGAGRHGRFAE